MQNSIDRAPAAISIAEFCHRYGIGKTTTYQEVNSGRLKVVKIGRRTLIRVSDAQAWFEAAASSKSGEAA
jgi:excisionase family DNA binding protein